MACGCLVLTGNLCDLWQELFYNFSCVVYFLKLIFRDPIYVSSACALIVIVLNSEYLSITNGIDIWYQNVSWMIRYNLYSIASIDFSLPPPPSQPSHTVALLTGCAAQSFEMTLEVGKWPRVVVTPWPDVNPIEYEQTSKSFSEPWSHKKKPLKTGLQDKWKVLRVFGKFKFNRIPDQPENYE